MGAPFLQISSRSTGACFDIIPRKRFLGNVRPIEFEAPPRLVEVWIKSRLGFRVSAVASSAVRVFALFLGALGVPGSAEAELFVGGGEARLLEQNALVVHQDGQETLVLQLNVGNAPARMVWLQPLPAFATDPVAVESSLFGALQRETRVEEPFHRIVRRQVLGPSLFNLLLKEWIEPPPATKTESEPLRPLSNRESRIFLGVPTSSASGYLLPPGLAGWLERWGVSPSPEDSSRVGQHLLTGGAVLAMVLEDPNPGRGPARIGPYSVRFAVNAPVMPALLTPREQADVIPRHFFVVTSSIVAPTSRQVLWDQEPWYPDEVSSDMLRISYHGEVSEALSFTLGNLAGVTIPPPHAQKLEVKRIVAPVAFAPTPDAPLIPASRGSLSDLLLCLMLGLAPLLYAPESWVLGWFTARARERARQGKSAFGTKLWTIWPIFTAAYWLFNLPASGRIAAVLPLVLGAVQLAVPYVDKDPQFIRLQFKKRTKKA